MMMSAIYNKKDKSMLAAWPGLAWLGVMMALLTIENKRRNCMINTKQVLYFLVAASCCMQCAGQSSCIGDRNTWNAGEGFCASYAQVGNLGNYRYCAVDCISLPSGLCAEEVCSECGKCTDDVPIPCSEKYNTNKWSGKQDCKNDSDCRLKVDGASWSCVAYGECDTDDGFYEYEGECRKCSDALKSCTSNCKANGSAYRITCDRSSKECSDYDMDFWEEKQACKKNDNCLLKTFGGGGSSCVAENECAKDEGFYEYEGECRKCSDRIPDCEFCDPGSNLWRPTCLRCKDGRVGANGNYCPDPPINSFMDDFNENLNNL